jgi:putative peptide zinc metalloprotease protein
MIFFDVVNHLVHYQLVQETQAIVQGLVRFAEQFSGQSNVQSKWSGILLLGIGLKLLKTVKVFKLALAAATVATYSVMFTFEFALALVGGLVFHEYGHLKAMKRFDIPTKGMYLIPFSSY